MFSISCSEAFSRTLTVRFRWWKAWSLIGLASGGWWQESCVFLWVGICLQTKTWSPLFKLFFSRLGRRFCRVCVGKFSRFSARVFRVWFVYEQQVYIGKEIRSTNVYQILVHYDEEIWFDFHENLPNLIQSCVSASLLWVVWASNLMEIKNWLTPSILPSLPVSIASKSPFESIPY